MLLSQFKEHVCYISSIINILMAFITEIRNLLFQQKNIIYFVFQWSIED